MALAAYATGEDANTALRLRADKNIATLTKLVEVASRRIDYVCGRTFHPPGAVESRVFPCGFAAEDGVSEAATDDVLLDPTPVVEVANSEFADEWTTLPAGSVRFASPKQEGYPVNLVRFQGSWRFVRVSAKYGWLQVPEPIQRATVILASRLFEREQSPLGTVASGGELGDVPVQRYDPDFLSLVQSYRRRRVG